MWKFIIHCLNFFALTAYRSSLDTKCKEGSKCFFGWNSESKAQAILYDEQAKEKSFKGAIPTLRLMFLLFFTVNNFLGIAASLGLSFLQ